MSRKIKITSLPDFARGGNYGNQTPPTNQMVSPWSGKLSKPGNPSGTEPPVKIRRKLAPVPREKANLEAEVGETVVTNLQKEGIPEFYKIGGKRHYAGGTPLNLPEQSFIFSRDKSMKLSGDDLLAPFGKSGNKGYTPAELSKQYDLNVYRQILADPDSDKLQRETAELMIKNYNLKLGALALAQESIKGFEDGVPGIAIPYMETMGINPAELLGEQMDQSVLSTTPQFKRGGTYKKKTRKVQITSLPRYQTKGEVPADEYYSDEDVLWYPNQEGYDKSQVRAGDYVWDEELQQMRPVKTVNKKAKAYTGPLYGDERLGAFQAPYSELVEEFKKEDVRQAFWKYYQAERDQAVERLNLSGDEIKAIKEKTIDDAIADFLYLQRINLSLAAKAKAEGKQLRDLTVGWDKNPNLANKTIQELGYDPVDDVTLGSFQVGYNGFVTMKGDPNDSKLVPNWAPMQIGEYNDQRLGINKYGVHRKNAVSKVDSWYGDTTAGQLVLPENEAFDYELIYGDEGKPGAEAEDIETKPFQEAPPPPPAKWWTQDLVNLGQAMRDRFLIPELRPWQAETDYREAVPTFVDFRGQAARAQALAKGLADANTTFAGPQGQAAMQAGLMRSMVDPLLQLQQAEIAANVNTANQFELANTGARNQFAMQKAANATNLYDKQTIYEQQLANTKRALEHNIVNAFNQGWTNKGMTQAVNSMQDNYGVDPTTGYVYFRKDPNLIEPDDSSRTVFSDRAAQLMHDYPELDFDTAAKLASLDAGYAVNSTNYPNFNPAPFMYPGAYGGYSGSEKDRG